VDDSTFPSAGGALDRRRWMGVLAKATAAELEAACAALVRPPAWTALRPPETGLALVRARVSGSGGAFNVGEMSMTRCAIALDDGTVGLAYVAGRSRRHAELAAAFDALLQRGDPAARAQVESLAAAQLRRRRELAAAVAPTRVEFFTVARDRA
jgi:alpha-D-ribose 1-methylphosphonate 5-triphosphate synthase subunit PhnG